jgi:transporter family-2 protein
VGAIDLTGVEPWKLLGGIASPLYTTSAILLLPRLGALASVGLFVTGQMLASLVVDGLGLFGVPQRAFGAGTALGALAVIAGIALVIRGPMPKRPGWIALGLLAGAVLPIQGAVNASLQADLRRPLAVALISFTVATVTILLVLLATRRTRPQWSGLKAMPWWGWLGGAAAATYVTATFLLIPLIGAATTVALTVTGQQLASAAIDQCGLFRLPKRALTAARAGGLALLIAGSSLVRLV